MNFLQITQSLRNKCAGMGGTPGTPVTVVSQTGDMGNLVDWAREAWVDIQSARPDWKFMRAEFTGTVSAAGNTLTAASAGVTDLGNWDAATLRCYKTARGASTEQFLVEWDYAVLRDTYLFGSQVASTPNVFAIRDRDMALVLGPATDAALTVSGEYVRAPQSMALDADVPTGLPAHFHMLIVFWAMTKFAGNQAAPEVLVDAQNQQEKLWHRLVLDWTPQVGMSGSLA